MIYFAITFALMLLIIILMAVGVIFGRNAIKGSCGGLNCLCVKKCDKRKKQETEQQESSVVNIDLTKN